MPIGAGSGAERYNETNGMRMTSAVQLGPMKTLICLLLIFSITACATCKSSDSYEVCRTKQRDHSQPRV
jgi:hypothetical protein